MNFIEANQVLDAVRDGFDYPENIINKALEMTGDITEYQLEKLDAGMRSQRLDCSIQKAQSGIWCSRSPRLVGIDDPGHRKAQGQTGGRSTQGSNE